MKVHNDRGMSRNRRRRNSQSALGELVSRRINRRQLLRGMLGSALAAGVGARVPASLALENPWLQSPGELLPEDHELQLIIAAGDPLLSGAMPYQPFNIDPAIAARQFGVNNDFIAILPHPVSGSPASDRLLLFANHEYPSPELMWPDLHEASAGREMTAEQVATTMELVGASVCELEYRQGQWLPIPGAGLNRRVTATSDILISGPAAGDPALRTSADPTGRRVKGTLSNCNGGVTPWGTVLTCEEGAGWIFAGDWQQADNADLLKRYYYDEEENDRHGWSRVAPRFNLQNEANEPNRYEWVVEIDPYNPQQPPVKRTALGRFAHEGAHTALAADGRLVVYLGDDWEFEYCYRFVTDQSYNPTDRSANRDLLDSGVLSVARFDEDGSLQWLPLVYGRGPLTAENGFSSQADVLINTRGAADLLGATPMDSPEGFKPHPDNGRVYIALTSNSDRQQANPANPRTNNRFGHLLELLPPQLEGGVDHGAERFRWELLALCGDPRDPAHNASFHPETTDSGWFTDPDNIAFDAGGNMWVCTDGIQPGGFDGLYRMAVAGPDRAKPELFYVPPTGAECCEPVFSADNKTLFLSIQHPGEGVTTLAEVQTHWPDSDNENPPRAGVVAITRADKEAIS